MRKNLIIFIVVGAALAVLGGTIFMLFNLDKSCNIKEFSLADYQWEVETFPSDKNVGQIDNAQTAVEKAKELWIDKFGTINGQPYNPINGRKIEVSYDSEEECWHIYGTLPPNTLGGVPHVIIRKDGKVIAIWHDD